MPDYPITPGAVTVPFCPTTWQQTLEEFAAHMTVTVPPVNGFIAQEATPAVGDQDKVWVKTSASAPYVVGFFAYQGGDWRPVPAPVGFTYFVDTGAANTWTITTGESFPDNAAYVSGRLWAIRVNANVTGATTLQIDSFSAKSVKKSNDQALVSGEIEAGQVVLVIYDPTAGEFELITTLGAQVNPYGAAVLKKSGATGSASQAITSATETTVEWNSTVDPGAVLVSVAANQFVLRPGSYLLDISVPVLGNPGGNQSYILLLRDVTNANATLATATMLFGTEDDTVFLNLKHPVTVASANNTYDVRFYSSINCTLGYPANIGTYNETYQTMSIVRLA